MHKHDLVKTEAGWECRVCKLQWKRKPTSKCVGIPCIDFQDKPKGAYWDDALAWYNLRVKPGAKAIAYRQKSSNRRYYCYNRDSLEKIRADVPDLIVSKQEKDLLGYLTEKQLEKQHKKPVAVARAVAVSYIDDDTGKIDFCKFYHPEDTEFTSADQYLCKSTLKKTYLLSNGWIKRLGEPDEIAQHERYKSNIYLYSRKRLESFLADNADEYSAWLDKRESMVARALPLIEHTETIRAQQKKCLKCRSSVMMEKGLFCAIYPTGLEKHQIPCGDWTPKSKSVD